MVTTRAAAATSVCALMLLAACEQPITPASAPAPSITRHATSAAVAVGAPAADVQRASAVLAARMSGWEHPSAHGAVPTRARVAPGIDAAASTVVGTPENLLDVARALDRLLSATTTGKPTPR